MDPIASLTSQLRMRDSLVGAQASDPVVPERPRRRRITVEPRLTRLRRRTIDK
jgi:hypothetical protein